MKNTERRHLSRVAELGCRVCIKHLGVESPAEVHHQRSGMGRMRAPYTRTMGLCPTHHRGSEGIHHLGLRVWEARFGSEAEMVDEVNELLGVVACS
jgi:hypothetical protein